MEVLLSPPATLNPNQALWEKGDFTMISKTMRNSGMLLVSQLGITPKHYILDLGCGDGTTALPAAKLGATVLGVDIARNLVDAGTKRAAEAHLTNVQFVQGDACNLQGLANNTFDFVISIFGAMFAPKPLEVAREMVRVTKPGGKIIMGNWIPNDLTLVAQILRISSSYLPPPPPGFISPMLWGNEAHILERFAAAGITHEMISFQRDLYSFDFNGSPEEFVQVFKHFYGPTMNAFEAAERNGIAKQLQRELEVLFKSQNQSQEPGRTSIPATFLKVEVTKP